MDYSNTQPPSTEKGQAAMDRDASSSEKIVQLKSEMDERISKMSEEMHSLQEAVGKMREDNERLREDNERLRDLIRRLADLGGEAQNALKKK